MTKQFDDTNRGALFKNERKTEDQHADYNGSINVTIPWERIAMWVKTNNGSDLSVDHWLNAWLKTSKTGKRFMSLSVKQKDGQPASRQPERGAGPSLKDEMDDEIPF